MNGTSSPSTRKPGGVSPWIVIALAVAALFAWGGGYAPLGVLLVLALAAYLIFRPSRPAAAQPDLGRRVEFLERRVAELQEAVDKLRGARPSPAAPTPQRAAAPPPRRAAPPPPPPPAQRPAAPPPRREPEPTPAPAAVSFDWGRTMSTADMMGAKALAFAGGVVTLLGVVFFFVLAVNRGWIGPGMRVAFGGVASAIVLGAGLWLQRRYETTYSALAAVGAGVAGAYATLLAAVSLYEMVSKPVAMVIAAAIGSVGVAVSLAWSAEIVAGFGLIGAMVVPVTLVFQGGLQEMGTAFVAVVFAGVAVVAVRERWWTLLQVAALVSVPQAVAQLAQADTPHAGIVTLAAIFWLLYLAAGLGFQLRLGPALASAPASFLTGGAVFAGASAALLYGQRDDGLQQGIALLVVASVYVLLAAVLFRRFRESATLLWALGLTAGAVGLAQALSGSSLTYAWAAEAALLAWLGSRVRDARFQLPALGYLTLALLHAIALEASPDHLFEAMHHPASGAPAVLTVALGAIVFGIVKRSWDEEARSTGILRAFDPLLSWLRRREAAIDAGAFALAAILIAYAASLGILELSQALSSGVVETPFEWGHVAISSVWALAGLVAVLTALRLRSKVGLALAFSWLALTAGKVVAFDAVTLEQTRYGISLLVIGAGWTLVGEAPPSHLVSQMSHPGRGVPSLLLVIGATATLAWALGWHERLRLSAIWTAGALAVYAASIAILEAAQRISPESVHTNFQRGHTAVSAFWGLLALVSLYVGLSRRRGLLRGGGFVLFGISLGKIFLFDLTSLSSAQRALSFLAMGAVLLLGGFFYQRLSAQFDR